MKPAATPQWLPVDCRCGHPDTAHPDGNCSCGCPEFRRDGHRYPLGWWVTSD